MSSETITTEATLPAARMTSTEADSPSWLVIGTLSRRELVRFFRQRNRVIGAIGQPTLFWILFGAGLGPSFQLPGMENSSMSYREYFFPGTLVLILLFTAIFSTISIIEDRREGFLQSVLVAPIRRWAMVMGKLLGASVIAVAQGLLFLLLGLTIGLKFSPLLLLGIVGFLFALSLALAALGFVIAWRLDSTQGFHAVMSMFLLPMWLLSGAFFPATEGVLGWLVRFNPLSYGVAGLRQLLYYHTPDALPPGTPSLVLCVSVTVAFAVVTFAAAWFSAGRRVAGDLL